MNDHELFEQEMAGVQRIPESHRVITRKRTIATPGEQYRREAAQRVLENDRNHLPTTFVQPVSPDATLSFKRQGIQSGVFERLRRGGYDIEAVIDLHGLTIEQARHEVHQFIQDCIQCEVRAALINHGKGGRAGQGQGVTVKSFLVRWLPMFPEVMAFHSAQKWDGGVGAVYILLKKTECAKEKNRLHLGLSSGKPEI